MKIVFLNNSCRVHSKNINLICFHGGLKFDLMTFYDVIILTSFS